MAAANANPIAGQPGRPTKGGADRSCSPRSLANLKPSSRSGRPLPRPSSAYLSQHQDQLTNLLNGVAKSPKQWQNWFWVCLGGMVLFIPTIWLNRGRWSPARAREDERKHEADVEAEFKQLVGANA